jgi:hypothetical protein
MPSAMKPYILPSDQTLRQCIFELSHEVIIMGGNLFLASVSKTIE